MKKSGVLAILSVLAIVFTAFNSHAQDKQEVRIVEEKTELESIVPASSYFAGLSGYTQRRNSAVGILGEGRHVVAGLVDVSGYSTDISGVYEGFFITDSNMSFGDKTLKLGAYGFGFAKGQTVNLFNLSGKKMLTVSTIRDDSMKRPRPLMMVGSDGGVRP